MLSLELRFISTTDPLYAHELELRYRVLREPLGHTRSDVPFPFERESLHLVALDAATTILGCVLFHRETPVSGRLLQMAVVPSRQGLGLGTQLVRALEAELRRRGVREVHLHARQSAVSFYERLGYEVYGEPYIEVSVEHRHMRRAL